MGEKFGGMPALGNKKEMLKKVALAVSGVVALGAVDNAVAGEKAIMGETKIDVRVMRMTGQDIKRPEKIIDAINNAPSSGKIEVDLSGKLANDNNEVIGNKNKPVYESADELARANGVVMSDEDMERRTGIK